MDAQCDFVAVVSGFLPCLFQVSFELFDSLIEGSIVIEKAHSCHSRLVSLPGAPSGSSSIAGRSLSAQAACNVDAFINGYTGKHIR